MWEEYCTSEHDALFGPIVFSIVLVLIQAGKALLRENTVYCLDQRETMRQHMKNQLPGTRWGLEVQCSVRGEWEEVVLGSIQHTDTLLAKVKVDDLFPLYRACTAGS